MIIKHIPVKLKDRANSSHPIASIDVFVKPIAATRAGKFDKFVRMFKGAKDTKRPKVQDLGLEVRVVLNNFGTPKLTLLDRILGRWYSEANGIFIDRKTRCVAFIEFDTSVDGCFLYAIRRVEQLSSLVAWHPQIDRQTSLEVSQVLTKYRESIASACPEYVRTQL